MGWHWTAFAAEPRCASDSSCNQKGAESTSPGAVSGSFNRPQRGALLKCTKEAAMRLPRPTAALCIIALQTTDTIPEQGSAHSPDCASRYGGFFHADMLGIRSIWLPGA
jgi:hypothetical protein